MADNPNPSSDVDDDNSEYDELNQIHFPITIVTKENASPHHEANQQQPTSDNKWNVVDENAILRCFHLSVAAHLQCESVSRFEPISGADEACIGRAMPRSESKSFEQKGDDCDNGAVPRSKSKIEVDCESPRKQVGEDCVNGSNLDMDRENKLMITESDDASTKEKNNTWTPAAVQLPPWALRF